MNEYENIDECDIIDAFDQQVMEEAAFFYTLADVADQIKRYDLTHILFELLNQGYITKDELRTTMKNLAEDLK